MTAPKKLTLRNKIGYGFGHVMNDLTASVWVTYLLVFLVQVVKLEKTLAGIVILVGQASDGISTIFIGYFSGFKYNLWLCNKVGNKLAWHVIGSIFLGLSHPFLFKPVFDYTNIGDQTAVFLYFCFFTTTTDFGWSIVENAHLAIIPDLTSSQNDKTGLVAIRHAINIAANLLIFIVTWLLIEDEQKLGPKDAHVFAYLTFISCGVGIVTNAIYFILIRLPDSATHDLEDPSKETNTIIYEKSPIITHTNISDESGKQNNMKDNPPNPKSNTNLLNVVKWLKNVQLYQIAIMHSTSRLILGLATVYFPLYLQNTLELPAKYVATIPLTLFISSFVTSMFLKKINNLLGRKSTFIIGTLIAISGELFILFGCNPGDENVEYYVYVIAIIIGIGATTLVVTSVALTAELIGQETNSSSFVYAFMSMTEKFPNGIAVLLIQYFTPTDMDTNPESRLYYRDVISYGSLSLGVLSLVVTFSLLNKVIGTSRNFGKKDEFIPAE